MKPRVCHICGYVIPDGVINPAHPLFGTVDHVIAKANGGDNSRRNLRPAHLRCNHIKGHAELTEHVRTECRTAIRECFAGKEHVYGRKKPKHYKKPDVPIKRIFWPELQSD